MAARRMTREEKAHALRIERSDVCLNCSAALDPEFEAVNIQIGHCDMCAFEWYPNFPPSYCDRTERNGVMTEDELAAYTAAAQEKATRLLRRW